MGHSRSQHFMLDSRDIESVKSQSVTQRASHAERTHRGTPLAPRQTPHLCRGQGTPQGFLTSISMVFHESIVSIVSRVKRAYESRRRMTHALN